MFLGRVVGAVWSTAKHPHLTGKRLLVIQPVTPELTNTGKPLICTDSVGAGKGELIYWVRGREASLPFVPEEVPVDTTVVGIVDEVHVKRPPAAEPPATPRRNSRKRPSC
jgi:ethanolamine utilization protein EutN